MKSKSAPKRSTKAVFKCTTAAAEGVPTKSPNSAGGEYKVGFWPIGNFVTQFWKDAPTWNKANAVQVVAGRPTSDIDAALEAGATISGMVTAAATGAPVEKVEACADAEPDANLNSNGARRRNAAGEYTIDGLGRRSIWSIYFYAQNAVADVVSAPYSAEPRSKSPPAEAPRR